MTGSTEPKTATVGTTGTRLVGGPYDGNVSFESLPVLAALQALPFVRVGRYRRVQLDDQTVYQWEGWS